MRFLVIPSALLVRCELQGELGKIPAVLFPCVRQGGGNNTRMSLSEVQF
jgi:hypothetical protein